ncbi:MAG TPA: FAD-dependent oxidoreductase [Casimicrobiaceae bacterium]|nr:FAD-dependent oxidoreductase [Casimicrobiaceae bacterium]
MNRDFDIAVVGGGIAGLTAAVRAAESGASVVCFDDGAIPGGLVANVGRLDDFPSAAAIAGATVADQLLKRARALDVNFVTATVTRLDDAGQGLRISAGADSYAIRAAIVASGGRLRRLEIPGEAELTGRGVSQCDWCDGGLYRGKQVAVVGGGNAAVQAALHLAEFCESAALIVRGASLRARRDYVLQAADNPKIRFFWETVVDRIIGDNGVEGLALRSVPDASTATEAFSAVFVFVGLEPNLGFLPATLKRDSAGYAITDVQFRSSVRGVFVVGAARSGNEGSLLAAMGEARTASALAVAQLD